MPPLGGFDIGPALAIYMDIVAARGLTALFHPAAEHAELQRRGADVHRQDVPAHTRPSFSSTDRSDSTCAAVRGASGLRGMPPLYPARVMAAFTPGGPYGPAIAWLIRVTRSCKRAPFRSSRACPHRNSSRAISGNELARDTAPPTEPPIMANSLDRKSTRLNSSHLVISYAV